jgi:hypothetical protein
MIATGATHFLCRLNSIDANIGTLALGINAPAKTAVFCGDSPFLTALMASLPALY